MCIPTWSEIPESRLVNNITEGGCQKEKYCDTIECREITKRLRIHDINNIIAMIECCQGIYKGQLM